MGGECVGAPTPPPVFFFSRLSERGFCRRVRSTSEPFAYMTLAAPSVYLAGPDVFYPHALAHLDRKAQVCRTHGLVPLVPVDNELEEASAGTPEALALGIYRGNLAQMAQADAIIANLTPFRGPHMDPGTAFEVGYFAALGKPVVCYTEHDQPLIDRVDAWSGEGQMSLSSQGEVRDVEGHLVENFGLRENLMIEGAALHQPQASARLGRQASFECFAQFETAVATLAAYFRAL